MIKNNTIFQKNKRFLYAYKINTLDPHKTLLIDYPDFILYKNFTIDRQEDSIFTDIELLLLGLKHSRYTKTLGI